VWWDIFHGGGGGLWGVKNADTLLSGYFTLFLPGMVGSAHGGCSWLKIVLVGALLTFLSPAAPGPPELVLLFE